MGAHSFVFISRETDNPHSARRDAMQRLKAYTGSAAAGADMERLDPIWAQADMHPTLACQYRISNIISIWMPFDYSLREIIEHA